MRDAYPLVVPLEVEVKVGPNWRDVSPQVEEELPLTGLRNEQQAAYQTPFRIKKSRDGLVTIPGTEYSYTAAR